LHRSLVWRWAGRLFPELLARNLRHSVVDLDEQTVSPCDAGDRGPRIQGRLLLDGACGLSALCGLEFGYEHGGVLPAGADRSGLFGYGPDEPVEQEYPRVSACDATDASGHDI